MYIARLEVNEWTWTSCICQKSHQCNKGRKIMGEDKTKTRAWRSKECLDVYAFMTHCLWFSIISWVKSRSAVVFPSGACIIGVEVHLVLMVFRCYKRNSIFNLSLDMSRQYAYQHNLSLGFAFASFTTDERQLTDQTSQKQFLKQRRSSSLETNFAWRVVQKWGLPAWGGLPEIWVVRVGYSTLGR